MGFLTSPWLANRPLSIFLLIATTVCGTLSMHVVTPVLPAIAQDFGVSTGSIQLTITLYLIGMAIGQLVYGPFSDRFGRRPVLIIGLSLYVVSMLVGALAADIGVMLLARVLQALGASCVLVIGRAMVRDSAEGPTLIARMAALSIALSASPAVAPVVGALVSAAFGWRMIFVLLTVISALFLAAVVLVQAETNQNKTPLPGLRPMLASYRALLRSRRFVCYAIGGASGNSFYAFLTASPFIFGPVLHRSQQEIGFLYLVTLAGFSLGSFIGMRIANRFSILTLARAGNRVMLFGPLLMLAAVLTDAFNIWTLMAPMLAFTVGAGLANPFAQAGAVGADPLRIGAAAGLFGFGQMAIGAICSLIVSLFGDAQTMPMILTMLAFAFLGQFCLLLLGREGR
jgi:DHA1 family bicyclomycin/chloramphenicol resistance-like MFS transporter